MCMGAYGGDSCWMYACLLDHTCHMHLHATLHTLN